MTNHYSGILTEEAHCVQGVFGSAIEVGNRVSAIRVSGWDQVVANGWWIIPLLSK